MLQNLRSELRRNLAYPELPQSVLRPDFAQRHRRPDPGAEQPEQIGRLRASGRKTPSLIRVAWGAAGQCILSRTGTAKQIGRASCRERVCQYVSISVVAVSLKKKA